MSKRRVTAGVCAGIAIAIAAACSSPSPTATVQETTPSEASFPPVALVLVQTCGTLDCHGQVGRNLRIYGNTGLRLRASDVPTSLLPTSADEISQDFASLVGLEPEIMSEVVADKGADPERLTFIRKMRGLESHKGNAVVVAGDARDVCITSWLAGATNDAQCTVALTYP
jgi:hypothetical protein